MSLLKKISCPRSYSNPVSKFPHTSNTHIALFIHFTLQICWNVTMQWIFHPLNMLTLTISHFFNLLLTHSHEITPPVCKDKSLRSFPPWIRSKHKQRVKVNLWKCVIRKWCHTPMALTSIFACAFHIAWHTTARTYFTPLISTGLMACVVIVTALLYTQ